MFPCCSREGTTGPDQHIWRMFLLLDWINNEGNWKCFNDCWSYIIIMLLNVHLMFRRMWRFTWIKGMVIRTSSEFFVPMMNFLSVPETWNGWEHLDYKRNSFKKLHSITLKTFSISDSHHCGLSVIVLTFSRLLWSHFTLLNHMNSDLEHKDSITWVFDDSPGLWFDLAVMFSSQILSNIQCSAMILYYVSLACDSGEWTQLDLPIFR